jgi:hypothetical protein
MEQAQRRLWVLLVYKVPREPTSSRAYVWRKLKRLGALLIHDAVWVLPATAWWEASSCGVFSRLNLQRIWRDRSR